MMNDHLVAFAGNALLLAICAWAVWFLAVHLRAIVQSGKAVDRTLSEIDKHDAPGMYALQSLGYVLLIGASAAIGTGALAALAWRLAAMSH